MNFIWGKGASCMKSTYVWQQLHPPSRTRRQWRLSSELQSNEVFPEIILKTIRTAERYQESPSTPRQGTHLNSSDIWKAWGMLLQEEGSKRPGLHSVFMSLPRSIAMALLKRDESAVFPEKNASGLKFSGRGEASPAPGSYVGSIACSPDPSELLSAGEILES